MSDSHKNPADKSMDELVWDIAPQSHDLSQGKIIALAQVCDIEGAFARGWWAGLDRGQPDRGQSFDTYPTTQFQAELEMLEADWLKFEAECKKAMEAIR